MKCQRAGRLTDIDVTRSRQIEEEEKNDWVSSKPAHMAIRELLVLSVALEAVHERNVCISRHYAGLRTL